MIDTDYERAEGWRRRRNLPPADFTSRLSQSWPGAPTCPTTVREVAADGGTLRIDERRMPPRNSQP